MSATTGLVIGWVAIVCTVIWLALRPYSDPAWRSELVVGSAQADLE